MLARSFSSLALPQHVAPAALWSTLARSRPLPHPDPNHPTSREFYASLWRGYGHNHGEEKGFTPRNPKKARSSSVNLPPLDSPLMKDRTKPGVADPDFPPTIENVETFLKSFLSSQTICVVATTGKNGVPRATPMGLFVDANPDSSHPFVIYLFTEGDPDEPSTQSTKLANMITNPAVSIAVHTEQFKGWDQLQGVQIQGYAVEITTDRESETWKEGVAAYQLKRGVLLREVVDVPRNWATCIKVLPSHIDYLDTTLIRVGWEPRHSWSVSAAS